jgi:DNA-binding beta-propeller fold protein YncE
VTADDRGVWVSSNANDSVVRFDRKTGTTIQTLSLEAGDGIPNGPTTILATSSGVWLASDLERGWSSGSTRRTTMSASPCG